MSHQPHFSLSIQHSYYQQQHCADFRLEPTQACQRILQRHRLVNKSSVGEVQILAPVEEKGEKQQSLVRSDDGLIFTFALKLKNPNFASFTTLDSHYKPGRSFYVFSNEKSEDSALQATVIQFQDLNKEKQSALAARCGAISELNSMHRSQIFGIVEIHHHRTFEQGSSQPSEFHISFAAKQHQWSYYLVADKALAIDTFSIRNKVTSEKQQELKFSRIESAQSDRIVASIQQRFPESQTVLLKSDQLVTCKDSGRTHLQLMKQDHEIPWIPNLPHPPDEHGIQIINLLTDL